jgi:lipid-A-disaccharide synthase
VIAYRTDPVSAFVARRALRVPHIGLPNLVLGERAFSELVQERVTAENLAQACCGLFADLERASASCERVRRALQLPDGSTPSGTVADLLTRWL